MNPLIGALLEGGRQQRRQERQAGVAGFHLDPAVQPGQGGPQALGAAARDEGRPQLPVGHRVQGEGLPGTGRPWPAYRRPWYVHSKMMDMAVRSPQELADERGAGNPWVREASDGEDRDQEDQHRVQGKGRGPRRPAAGHRRCPPARPSRRSTGYSIAWAASAASPPA